MFVAAAITSDVAIAPHVDLTVAILRLTIAAVLGAIVGLERQTHGRAAGLRTMMLVCLGCCLVMLVSNAFAEVYWPYRTDGDNILRVDPARLAYSVMGGIGFLGAGAILKSGFSIRGLTTAATIWCVAAIGLAVGLGLYYQAIATTALVMLALFVLDRIEAMLPTHWYKTLEVVLKDGPGTIDTFCKKIEQNAAKVLDMQFERRADGTVRASFNIRLPDRKDMIRFFDAVAHEPEVQSIQMR